MKTSTSFVLEDADRSKYAENTKGMRYRVIIGELQLRDVMKKELDNTNIGQLLVKLGK